MGAAGELPDVESTCCTGPHNVVVGRADRSVDRLSPSTHRLARLIGSTARRASERLAGERTVDLGRSDHEKSTRLPRTTTSSAAVRTIRDGASALFTPGLGKRERFYCNEMHRSTTVRDTAQLLVADAQMGIQ